MLPCHASANGCKAASKGERSCARATCRALAPLHAGHVARCIHSRLRGVPFFTSDTAGVSSHLVGEDYHFTWAPPGHVDKWGRPCGYKEVCSANCLPT